MFFPQKELGSFDLENSEYGPSDESFDGESPIKFASPVHFRKYHSSDKVVKDVLKKYKKYKESFSSEDQNESLTYSKRWLAENNMKRADIELTLNGSDMKEVESLVKKCLTEKELDCYESIKDKILLLQEKLRAKGLKRDEIKEYLKNHVPSLNLKGQGWKLYNIYFIKSTNTYDENYVNKFIKLLKKTGGRKKIRTTKS